MNRAVLTKRRIIMKKTFIFNCVLVVLLCSTLFAVEVFAQPTGSGTKDDPYQIGTEEDLEWFVDYVNNSSLTKEEMTNAHNAVLTGNIIVNESAISSSTNSSSVKHWNMIKEYNAIFDGKGYSISGLYCDNDIEPIDSDGIGVSGFVGIADENSEIRNLGLANSYFSSKNGYIGSICGYNMGLISNCHSSADLNFPTAMVTSDKRVGGVCGVNYGTIEKSYMAGTITTAYRKNSYKNQVGGIAALTYGTIDLCYNSGKIKSEWTGSSTSYVSFVGGIAGFAEDGSIISNSYNEGTITTPYHDLTTFVQMGGIAGCTKGTIDNCYNTADIYNGNGNNNCDTGGITGFLSGNIINSYNIGTVSSEYCNSTGGISGYMYYGSSIENCYNTGVIKNSSYKATALKTIKDTNDNSVGGICGYTDSRGFSSIANCYNEGEIYGSNYAGGIVGWLRGSDSVIKKCRNEANISAVNGRYNALSSACAGGVCGYSDENTAIESCFGKGKMTFKVDSSKTSGRIYGGGISGFNNGMIINSCAYVSGCSASATNNSTTEQYRFYGGIAGKNTSLASFVNNFSYINRNGLTLTNNSVAQYTGYDGYSTTSEEFASGKIAYLLNRYTSSRENDWYQNVTRGETDAYPVLDASHYTVYYDAENDAYVNDPNETKQEEEPEEKPTDDKPVYLYGDVDNSGDITVKDAVHILKKVSNPNYKFPIEGGENTENPEDTDSEMEE